MLILEGLCTFSRTPGASQKEGFPEPKCEKQAPEAVKGGIRPNFGPDHGLLLNVSVLRCVDVAVPPP